MAPLHRNSDLPIGLRVTFRRKIYPICFFEQQRVALLVARPTVSAGVKGADTDDRDSIARGGIAGRLNQPPPAPILSTVKGTAVRVSYGIRGHRFKQPIVAFKHVLF